MATYRRNLLVLMCLLGSVGQASAIDIVFDYSLDTNNFFDSQVKRDVMDEAAAIFEIFTDDLDAIVPGTVYNPGTVDEFSDTWDATFTHPGTGSPYAVTDLMIPSDTILVYVGGRSLPGTTIGEGGPGGYTVSGIGSFVSAVQTRGETGVTAPLPDDFGPWGGAVTFDTGNSWHFDTSTSPGPTESDFFSVAVHELAHLLGFGTATSFDVLASGTTFLGTASTTLFGSNPPLHFDQAHWQIGTTSLIPGGGAQETAMDPDILDGEIKTFTLLDYAAMDDLGWDVPPLSPGGLEGDLNGDGYVGLNDLDIILNNWNQNVAPGDPLLGDPTGDGYVGLDDLDVVLNNWNTGTPPPGSVFPGKATIPEPGSLVLMGLCSAGLLSRR